MPFSASSIMLYINMHKQYALKILKTQVHNNVYNNFFGEWGNFLCKKDHIFSKYCKIAIDILKQDGYN